MFGLDCPPFLLEIVVPYDPGPPAAPCPAPPVPALAPGAIGGRFSVRRMAGGGGAGEGLEAGRWASARRVAGRVSKSQRAQSTGGGWLGD
jgi:hypothetical protein